MSGKTTNVGMIGCGTVGGGVARLLHDLAEVYEKRIGSRPVLAKVLVRNVDKGDRGCPLPAEALTDDVEDFFDTPDMPVVIEVAGSVAMLDPVERALSMGKHVVTANKSLLAAHGPRLFGHARKNNAAIAFEASCGGGIPIVTAVKFGLMANRVEAMHGILNGTCNYILTEMTQKGKDYATALREAQEAGFAEADPTMDVSGRDAAEKLAILASLAFGAKIDVESVPMCGIDNLDLTDIRFGAELGYDVKLLAIAEQSPGVNDSGAGITLRVEPCFVHADHLLAAVHGPFNALSVYGHATGHTMYFGRGAGRMPTASAVVSDLLNVLSGWYPAAFTGMNIWPDRQEAVRLVDPAERTSRFYLRMNALDVPGVMARITHILGEAGISISAVLQHEDNAGQFVPIVVLTHEARQGAVRDALQRIEQMEHIDGPPICLNVVEMPEG